MSEQDRAVEAYRKAATKLWPGYTMAEAEQGIVHPDDDNGQWAPGSLAVIYMEGQTPMDYWGDGHDKAYELGQMAGIGYVEFINAAVAAVYE
jgi:hypothetical protein